MTTTATNSSTSSTIEITKDVSLLPNCQILVRSKEGVEVFSIPSSTSSTSSADPSPSLPPRNFLMRGSTTLQAFSPNGHYVYLHQSNVGIIRRSLLNNNNTDNNSSNNNTPFLVGSQNVQVLAVSPLGTYLLTWERWKSSTTTATSTGGDAASAAATEAQLPNLKLWKADTGVFVWGTVQKNLKREGWPYLQWTHDEAYAMLLSTNELRVYQGKDVAALAATAAATNNNNDNTPSLRFVDQIRCTGVVSFSLPDLNNPNKALMSTPQPSSGDASSSSSTSASYYFTCFSSKNKDQPSRVSFHVYPPPPATANTPAGVKKPSGYPALISKSSHQADECHIHWNPKGDACLVSIQTSVDTSGESYYGSSTLLLLRRDATDAILVPLPNASSNPSVSDVSWMPNPHVPPCFLVISGKMPTTTSLHHGVTADPLYMLGQGHRNTSAWAPHGRFFALAGFGNLAGGMSFWDRNKLKPMESAGGPVTAPCTVGWSWSPDSRMVVTSITSPRRNVDNGIRMFRYNGIEITNTMPWNNTQYYHPDKLLQVSFVPSDVSYPDRPQSPKPRRANEESAAGETTTTAAPAAAAAVATQAPPTASAPAAPKRYVPPSARGRPSDGTSLADRMRRETEKPQATKVVAFAAGTTGGKSSVPGMAPIKKSIPGLNPPSAKSSSSSKKSKRPKPKTSGTVEESDGAVTTRANENEAKPEPVAATAAAAAASAAEVVEVDPEKRARKLKKTLKQIDDIKTKPASEWNDDQKKKIASEQQIREELAQLGF